ncbi:hypothetical protein K505DRAFT_331225 [Melanomma pulvis-pyrius CBS 109.77]|uniref:Uncharacterized protein n=1 Tax=Melanomma pulvis-pyrius CBS 109.77 TaxID=1314802 RepID=A0A6A6XX00_9PLEO|nr:hypothetical protein K505DRAFT_331225 [Melanomma pulvis-pyrius CBS 109.77]
MDGLRRSGGQRTRGRGSASLREKEKEKAREAEGGIDGRCTCMDWHSASEDGLLEAPGLRSGDGHGPVVQVVAASHVRAVVLPASQTEETKGGRRIIPHARYRGSGPADHEPARSERKRHGGDSPRMAPGGSSFYPMLQLLGLLAARRGPRTQRWSGEGATQAQTSTPRSHRDMAPALHGAPRAGFEMQSERVFANLLRPILLRPLSSLSGVRAAPSREFWNCDLPEGRPWPDALEGVGTAPISSRWAARANLKSSISTQSADTGVDVGVM